MSRYFFPVSCFAYTWRAESVWAPAAGVASRSAGSASSDGADPPVGSGGFDAPPSAFV